MNLERLYFLREENDLTQREMGKIIGVSRAAISQWENTKEIIPLEKLNIYANYFKVSMDYIVGFSNIKKAKIVEDKPVLDRKVIGKKLLEIRKKNQVTQSQLAQILNTSHSTISAYENGKTLILTTFAYQICLKYGVSMDFLCDRI